MGILRTENKSTKEVIKEVLTEVTKKVTKETSSGLESRVETAAEKTKIDDSNKRKTRGTSVDTTNQKRVKMDEIPLENVINGVQGHSRRCHRRESKNDENSSATTEDLIKCQINNTKEKDAHSKEKEVETLEKSQPNKESQEDNLENCNI